MISTRRKNDLSKTIDFLKHAAFSLEDIWNIYYADFLQDEYTAEEIIYIAELCFINLNDDDKIEIYKHAPIQCHIENNNFPKEEYYSKHNSDVVVTAQVQEKQNNIDFTNNETEIISKKDVVETNLRKTANTEKNAIVNSVIEKPTEDDDFNYDDDLEDDIDDILEKLDNDKITPLDAIKAICEIDDYYYEDLLNKSIEALADKRTTTAFIIDLFAYFEISISKEFKNILLNIENNDEISDELMSKCCNMEVYEKLIYSKRSILEYEKIDYLEFFIGEYEAELISESFLEKVGLIFNKCFTPSFRNESENSRHNNLHLNEEVFMTIVKPLASSTVTKCKSFKNFLELIDLSQYKYKTYDAFLKPTKLCQATNDIIHDSLVEDEFSIEQKEMVKFRPSKQLNLDATSKKMDFGTKLHFIMEATDFINPDYDNINDLLAKKVISNFLHSFLTINIRNAKIYKEYEFYDITNNVDGIIDLMLVYDDHIDIIDYKTKNISDASYRKQLLIYADYITKSFNKDVHTYLYSLLTSDVVKVS